MDGLHGHGKMYGNGKSVEELAWIQSQEIINHRPTAPLDVYVFGEGAFGELGLGSASNATEVKRPRLNPLLSADSVGVVQVAVGGMHCAALTHDNRILTWGVNDQGALGRDTDWDGGVRETNANDSDAESDSGLNPRESTPTAIPSDAFPDETEFTQVVCGDSCTFALTEGGQVYGWGTFRVRRWCDFPLGAFPHEDRLTVDELVQRGYHGVYGGRLGSGSTHVDPEDA